MSDARKFKICRKPQRGSINSVSVRRHFLFNHALVTFGEERHRWERDHGERLKVFGLSGDLTDLEKSQYVIACTDVNDPLGSAKVWMYKS